MSDRRSPFFRGRTSCFRSSATQIWRVSRMALFQRIFFFPGTFLPRSSVGGFLDRSLPPLVGGLAGSYPILVLLIARNGSVRPFPFPSDPRLPYPSLAPFLSLEIVRTLCAFVQDVVRSTHSHYSHNCSVFESICCDYVS